MEIWPYLTKIDTHDEIFLLNILLSKNPSQNSFLTEPVSSIERPIMMV